MKVTWEVRRKFFKWKLIETFDNYQEAHQLEMKLSGKWYGKLFHWQLRGFSNEKTI